MVERGWQASFGKRETETHENPQVRARAKQFDRGILKLTKTPNYGPRRTRPSELRFNFTEPEEWASENVNVEEQNKAPKPEDSIHVVHTGHT